MAKKIIKTDKNPEGGKDIPILSFPIVGIGASAGGLAAFEAFFAGMPKDIEPNMAFIIVQHLAPDHKSILCELISRYTQMNVYEVIDGMEVKQNCAYIIPPNHNMAFINGTLQLLEPSAPRGMRLSIDFFFRSLAQDQKERAICIVLSGTGSDGTLGVRVIKGEGGMAMAQDPLTTEYDGMPRSAIDTGLVDYILAPKDMANQLIKYASHAFNQEGQAFYPLPKAENALKKIFIILRSQVGHDFSKYKPSTILRRIERRMAVHQIEKIDDYVSFLQSTSSETEALFKDLLIGVTSFFRDIDAFSALESKVIDELFTNRSPDSVIRIWIPGCSTGEEAYSIAILLTERQDALKQKFKVQIFATDIDSNAINVARIGVYTGNIAADVSAERLHRFFDYESSDLNGVPNSYRIRKAIRDMIIFSEQDVIKDPPFSKLDLISCRNLLIYMGQELQNKLILLFHYALKAGGYLFLGTSETIGDFNAYFKSLDRKEKIFQREINLEDRNIVLGTYVSSVISPMNQYSQRPIKKDIDFTKITLRELTEKAILAQTPASVLIDEKGNILYIHGRTGKFLESPQGEFGSNIIKMARNGLTQALTVLLNKAVKELEVKYSYGVKVKTDHGIINIDLSIHPVLQNPKENYKSYLFLVVFVEVAEVDNANQHSSNVSEIDIETDARVMALTKELKAKEEYLQSSNEELETSNEELKSSNEEMQSVNEELQSTNEEMETSKEELQSVNEELATVNAELQAKVSELSTVNNDMNNLLSGASIATIFVDLDLNILRFNVAANRIINLILGDIGRPVGHVVSNLADYNTLVEDVKEVIDTLIAKELIVTSKDKRIYTMRIQPYRTIDNIIKGAVITYTDVTECKSAERKLKQYTSTLLGIQKLAQIGAWDWNCETQKLNWSVEKFRILDMDPAEFLDGTDRCFIRSLECYKSKDRIIIANAYKALIEKGVAYDLVFDIITFKKRSIRIRTWAEPLFENSIMIQAIGVVMEVLNDAKSIQSGELNEQS